MGILYFIVGLVTVVSPFILIYLLGVFIMKKISNYDEHTEIGEVFSYGVLTLGLTGLLISLIGLIYASGEIIVKGLL
jgi:maltodextrin utilization protein YvdJ